MQSVQSLRQFGCYLIGYAGVTPGLNNLRPIQFAHTHHNTPGVVHGDLPVNCHDALLQGKAGISTLLKEDTTTLP
jgi:hypothetical protein